MFNTLIVSRPRATRVWRRELAGPSFSLVAHSLILYAAAMATAAPGAGGPGVRDTTVFYLRSFSRRNPEPRAPAAPRVFRTLVAPAVIPTSIPPVDLTTPWDAGSYSGVGVMAGPVLRGEGPANLTPVFVAWMVDQPPVSISFPPPEYPRALAAARIEGLVLLQAVIDTLGRVEPGSIKVISSTNRGFEAAAQAALRAALFRPGRVQGQKVRVLVHQPLRFALPR